METQKTTIANITKRLSKGLNRWSNTTSSSEALKSRLLSMLDMELSLLSFDKESSKSMLHTVILRTLSSDYNDAYRLAYPPIEYK